MSDEGTYTDSTGIDLSQVADANSDGWETWVDPYTGGFTNEFTGTQLSYPTDPGITDPSLAGFYKQNADGTWSAASTNPTDQRLAAGTQVSPGVDWSAVTTDGKWDLAKLAAKGLTLAGAISAYNQAKNPPQTGYQGGIPKFTATREAVPAAQTARPGAGGQRYLTDVAYSLPATGTTTSGLPAAQAAVAAQAATLASNNEGNAMRQQQAQPPAQTPAQMQTAQDQFYGRVPAPVQAAQGGLMGLAQGGQPHAPRYLQGNTDGMADKIPAQIDGHQPAALAHGEFVVPADVVSHLGNGNSDAGAQVLYKMMDKIRKARTGTTKQGKEIDPNKFAPGGMAYAAGGAVQHFAAGDVVAPAGVVGTESNLSNWAGPYVTDMLGKGQALSQQPYQAYQGPLTAGDSSLQQQAYGMAGGLQTPAGIGTAANAAGTIGQSSFNAPGVASSFMSPYTQNVVDQQKQEAQRTADIATTQRHGQQVQQGAFGGSRGAVMDAEAARNLALQQGGIQAQGLQGAFTAGQQQYNTQQNTGLAAASAQGNLSNMQNQAGVTNLNTLAGLGATQQATQQAGITADQAAFTQERDNPYKMVQYQQSLLQGLPLAAQSYNTATNPYSAAANVLSGVNAVTG